MLDKIIHKDEPYKIGDRVIVTGSLYQYANGTGSFIDKAYETMYIVDILDPGQYEYIYGIATQPYMSRQGWCNEGALTKVI